MNGSSNKKKITTVLILAAILVMPGFLYYLLQDQGKNRYKPLAYFGPKEVAKTFHSVRGKQIPDTIYHQVSPFSLINQLADSVDLTNWKGKVVVVNLFYTNATSSGAKMAQKAMLGFEKMYHNNSMVHLVTISVDKNDTPQNLKTFVKGLNIEPKKWDFLTGDTAVINNLIKKSLLLDFVDESTANERKFIYSNKFVLLDTKHRIRGFYDSANNDALSKLDDEIKVQIAEELRNIKDGR